MRYLAPMLALVLLTSCTRGVGDVCLAYCDDPASTDAEFESCMAKCRSCVRIRPAAECTP